MEQTWQEIVKNSVHSRGAGKAPDGCSYVSDNTPFDAAGEHAPAALAMVGALALQAMMLGLPHASSADSDVFWRVRTFLRVNRSGVPIAVGCGSRSDLVVTSGNIALT